MLNSINLNTWFQEIPPLNWWRDKFFEYLTAVHEYLADLEIGICAPRFPKGRKALFYCLHQNGRTLYVSCSYCDLESLKVLYQSCFRFTEGQVFMWRHLHQHLQQLEKLIEWNYRRIGDHKLNWTLHNLTNLFLLFFFPLCSFRHIHVLTFINIFSHTVQAFRGF